VRALVGLAVLTLTLTGCAGWSLLPDDALARAERLVEQGDYGAAVNAYNEFLARYPHETRARASRDALASLLAARAEVARLRDTLALRDGELTKLRQEMQRLTQEADRMRTDLETLKEIDLRKEPKRR
jgi:hypothetical protein